MRACKRGMSVIFRSPRKATRNKAQVIKTVFRVFAWHSNAYDRSTLTRTQSLAFEVKCNRQYVVKPNSWVGRLDKVSETYRFLSPSLGFYGESSWLSFTRNSSTEPEALHEVENRRLSSS